MSYVQAREKQESLGIVFFIEDGIEVYIDLNEVTSASTRVSEIAHVTKLTAPELCEALGRSHRQLDIIVNRVKAAKNEAKANLDRTYAYLRLHEVREKLKELGLRDSESNIDSQIKLDEGYANSLDFLNHLHWVIDDLESRREEIRRAHATARGIAGAVELNRGSFSAGSLERETVGTNKPSFGRPHY